MTANRDTASTVKVCKSGIDIEQTFTVNIAGVTYNATIEALCDDCYLVTFTIPCEAKSGPADFILLGNASEVYTDIIFVR